MYECVHIHGSDKAVIQKITVQVMTEGWFNKLNFDTMFNKAVEHVECKTHLLHMYIQMRIEFFYKLNYNY